MTTSADTTMSGPDPEIPTTALALTYAPEEEDALVKESDVLKSSANTLFAHGDYSSAVQGYEKAISICPAYLEYELAVLNSNISACHLKLEAWKAAIDTSTAALEGLDRITPKARADDQEDSVEVVDEQTAIRIEAATRRGRTLEDSQKLRIKALLRRAKARRTVGGWASLQGAMEDYTELSKASSLSILDRNTIQLALQQLPNELEEAKSKEVGQMMGQLKQLGNRILNPFGLSTDNFKFVKDEASGGYSMQFNQN